METDETRHLTEGSEFEAHAGYSRGISSGGFIAVSGTAPALADGGCPAGARAQVHRCFERIAETLALAGASLNDVIRTRLYVVDPANVEEIVAAHGEVMGAVRPASTLVVVNGLLDPDWLVEIEVDARQPAAQR